jgi:hypothetical protein
MAGGGLSAEEYARRQNVAMKIYEEKHPMKILVVQEHGVHSSNIS